MPLKPFLVPRINALGSLSRMVHQGTFARSPEVSMRASNLPASAPRGRPFVRGNPGRQAGSQNRTTRVAAALLEGDAEALVRKAIELALTGDRPMLKFLLGRILPRERTIKINIPTLQSADDAVEAIAAIMLEVGEGNISPTEGAALAGIINADREAIDLAHVVKRIDALKEKVE